MKTNPNIKSVPVPGAETIKQATARDASAKAAYLKGDGPKPAPSAVTAPKPKPSLPAGMKHDKTLLLGVFNIQNPSRNRACNNHAMKTIESLAPPGCTVVRNKGNMLIRKGPATGPHPFFLSHMDQVHDYQPFMKVHVSGNVLGAVDGNEDQCGVGGDDKCGVYLALRMLHVLDHCTAVFVRDEEVGCLGSGEVPLAWFRHAAFVIQADRNNRTMDIIRDTNGMNCASDEFIAALMGLPIVVAAGHDENYGSITDIGELASRGLDISMINISSGYHNPHSSREVVHLDELAIACQLAFEAASLLGGQAWIHMAESQYFQAKAAPTNYGNNVGRYGDWGATGWDYETQDWSPATSMTEADLLKEEEADALLREDTIAELCDTYGHDRDFDCLDNWATDDLLDLLDDELTATLHAIGDTK